MTWLGLGLGLSLGVRVGVRARVRLRLRLRVVVGGGDHLLVGDAAARGDDVLDAARRGEVDRVAEGEEGVRGQADALERGEELGLVAQGERLGLLGELREVGTWGGEVLQEIGEGYEVLQEVREVGEGCEVRGER